MADRLTPARRSWLMSRVGAKNTSAEMRVRSAAHARGLRYRIHRKDLFGTPDIVFPKWRIAVFVHGCFWHRHPGCKKATMPKSRVDFWKQKFDHNVARDRANVAALEAAGWQVEIIWECETKSQEALSARLERVFGAPDA
ncbi:very short patch repair endonuclease [Mesorhizobium sp.]|uniref:very short patch repair endonuclease n=1 Tax=Mesorhizobium sp. TaxID=1871066 RepID=UPI000FE4ADEF|nr:very short patch repair endonuclease [Mesorhizobium sp.]RWA58382.1 MAG: DNA mismatch endonuclease Vsr [Mesorhizobium sp.]